MMSHGMVFLCVAVAGSYGWWYGTDNKVTDIQLLNSKSKTVCIWYFCFIKPGQTYTLRFTWTIPTDTSEQEFSAQLETTDIVYEDSVCFTSSTKSVSVDLAQTGCADSCVIPAGVYTVDIPLAIPIFQGISYLLFRINDDLGIYSVVAVK